MSELTPEEMERRKLTEQDRLDAKEIADVWILHPENYLSDSEKIFIKLVAALDEARAQSSVLTDRIEELEMQLAQRDARIAELEVWLDIAGKLCNCKRMNQEENDKEIER